MKLADKIKYDLMKWCRSTDSDTIIPNFFINSYYEMDLFRMTKAGIVYEYEIKISRSDFNNDFKKGAFDGWKQPTNTSKHIEIESGQRICNRFYFVVPENLVSLEEVPNYCGLIYYDKEHFKIVRPAKFLHRNKFTDYKMLSEKLTYRMNLVEKRHYYAKIVKKENGKFARKCYELLIKNNIPIPEHSLHCDF